MKRLTTTLMVLALAGGFGQATKAAPAETVPASGSPGLGSMSLPGWLLSLF